VVFALGLWVSLSAASGATASATTTKTFASTGAQQTFTVPDGVAKIHVVTVGGHGGAGAGSGAPRGGSGALLSADLPVTPGQVLFVEVGANALDSTGAAAPGLDDRDEKSAEQEGCEQSRGPVDP